MTAERCHEATFMTVPKIVFSGASLFVSQDSGTGFHFHCCLPDINDTDFLIGSSFRSERHFEGLVAAVDIPSYFAY